MTGADVLTYLQRRYARLLAQATDSTDAQADFTADAVREAFVVTGVLTDASVITNQTTWQTATLAQGEDVLAVARYSLLRVLCEQYAILADVSADMPVVAKKQSQIHAQALLMLADAEAEIAQRGYGKSAMQMGRLQLDFLEPTYGYGYGGTLLSPENGW